MPRAPIATSVARPLIGGFLLAAGAALAGCGVPPDLPEPPSALASPSATPTSVGPGTPTSGPRPAPTRPNATPTLDSRIARDCQGRPSGAQVVALLRRSNLLPRDVAVTVASAPVCAGSWQYTVIRVTDHEPLQVVSKGPPTALTLVTAGTDVCSIPVRTAAPVGIRTVACL